MFTRRDTVLIGPEQSAVATSRSFSFFFFALSDLPKQTLNSDSGYQLYSMPEPNERRTEAGNMSPEAAGGRRPATSGRIPVPTRVFLPIGGIKPPPTGYGIPDRFDRLPEKIGQIQNSNKK
jgi:hypothetical protein